MNAPRTSAIVVAAILGGWTQAALAQGPAILEGRVRDISTAQPLPGVSVTILDTGAETRTSRWGVYRLACGTATEFNVRLVRSRLRNNR